MSSTWTGQRIASLCGNEILWPREYPLSHHELSYLLPHFLKEGRGRLDTYFTRVYNPVWTNPDGMSWVEVLPDEGHEILGTANRAVFLQAVVHWLTTHLLEVDQRSA